MNKTPKFASRSELCKFLGISDPAFIKALRSGHPDPVKGRGFEVEASCRWFSLRPGNGKAKAKALEHLARIAPKPPETPIPKAKVRAGKQGIEAGVKRLRAAEESLHRAWVQSKEEERADAQVRFRNWQEALDLLTRAEQGLVKYLKEMETLTETAKFKALMKRNIEAAKSILLDVPGRVAPQCENLPWPQIQKLLEGEVRRTLEKLAAIA